MFTGGNNLDQIPSDVDTVGEFFSSARSKNINI